MATMRIPKVISPKCKACRLQAYVKVKPFLNKLWRLKKWSTILGLRPYFDVRYN